MEKSKSSYYLECFSLYGFILLCLMIFFITSKEFLNLMTMNRPEGFGPIILLIILAINILLLNVSLLLTMYLASKKLILQLKQ